MLPPRRERDESPRAKRSNTSGCRSAGMPGPSSRTVSTATPSAPTVSEVVTEVPGGVCTRALVNRFAST